MKKITQEEIQRLQKLAGITEISVVKPGTFDLTFVKNNIKNILELTTKDINPNGKFRITEYEDEGFPVIEVMDKNDEVYVLYLFDSKYDIDELEIGSEIHETALNGTKFKYYQVSG